ncbi:unnamed protein product [Rotaria sordida]|uniref:Uncharacterized protein n=1 Tax=Rotaria sordida TaxID=392033 RepID=A0A814TU68_9BILA|nr:unnamed protein product [Rotaria sordida]CAF1418834.1 unnamed protein product [Rotaria sordida]
MNTIIIALLGLCLVFVAHGIPVSPSLEDSVQAIASDGTSSEKLAGHPYILVVTTHGNADTGSFLISATGPASVDLMSITPTTSQPMIIPSIVPTTSSSYSSSLSSSSGVFQRVSGDPEYYYYYQAIQVTVSTSATTEPSHLSSYSSELTSNSAIFYRVDGDSESTYHYQAIQVTVSISGTYTFASDSDLDTVGYFYDTSFDPSVPTENLVTDNDDGGDMRYQFRIEAFLEAGHTYILVVTTHTGSETGSFSVEANGPDSVNLVSITPSTSRPITAVPTEPFVSSSLPSELSSNSLTFHRPDRDAEHNYYYQAIEVIVATSGAYTFTSDSEIDTMGFFYDTAFDPSNPTANLITENDDGGDISLQFHIEAFLQAEHKYILVVTTHGESEIGSFSILAGGPASVGLRSSTP